MMNMGWCKSSTLCVVENVLYRCNGKIYWYNFNDRLWRDLKGLDVVLYSRLCIDDHVKMMGFSGNMAILWNEYDKFCMKKIWFAEIEIEKDLFGELWGRFKSFDVVFTTSERYSVAHALATTI
ncbi:unnamed protein product [Eruca vesicaria subsp. sativa]|uniref:FKB95-like N-terminal Kelch domain-containing protein n=1 Tax=Eruca vesicaria subsp. sativa TaxID=29727 RepID=A0ABC8JXR5_ERUVS|nr:unnamed protein product [Eruca vesicaria subsp. sativa]